MGKSRKLKQAEYLRQWRSKNPDKVLEMSRRNAETRNAKRRYRYATDPKYRADRIAAAQGLYRRMRDEMFAAYGDACACCGEKCRPFLTIEHLKPNDPGRFRPGGTQEYLRLSKAGWPKDQATVMCMNCNHARGRLGECPHVLTVKNLTES